MTETIQQSETTNKQTNKQTNKECYSSTEDYFCLFIENNSLEISASA